MITQDRLKELLHYDPETGVFTWRQRRGGLATAGAIAGQKNAAGYVLIKVGPKRYMAHRLAWMYAYGAWPELQIDHINRHPGDNRLANLRLVTSKLNSENRGVFANNKSGVSGVYWIARLRKWAACITHHGKQIHLGVFSESEQATTARRSAENRYWTASSVSQ